MLAYIVNGEVEEVISKVNDKIESQKNKSEIIFYNNLFIGKLKILQSNHSERNLKHLFFDFTT